MGTSSCKAMRNVSAQAALWLLLRLVKSLLLLCYLGFRVLLLCYCCASVGCGTAV